MSYFRSDVAVYLKLPQSQNDVLFVELILNILSCVFIISTQIKVRCLCRSCTQHINTEPKPRHITPEYLRNCLSFFTSLVIKKEKIYYKKTKKKNSTFLAVLHLKVTIIGGLQHGSE